MSEPKTETLYLKNPGVEKLFDLTYDAANRCIQCGYCLPACPTYESMGKESASPRGRINLVKMAAEGKIDLQNDLAEPIDLCLGCRACEMACPVNVPYGQIYEAAKQVIADDKKQKQIPVVEVEHPIQKQNSSTQDLMKTLTFNHLFPHPGRFRALGNIVWFYQKVGLAGLVRKTKILNQISEPLAQFEKILPQMESPAKRNKPGTIKPSMGEKKTRVALFSGCIMDAVMYRTNRLTVELLRSVGCEVVIPDGQNCCGALHSHQGRGEQAKALAKANIEAFENSEVEFYINNAGGCGAMLCEYDHLLKDEPEWHERAKRFVKKSKDVTEVLAENGPLPFKKNWEGTITYQDSCHLRNVQGVSEAPRQLLRSIPGAEFVEMDGCDRCCASGGIYNILHFQESMKILDGKMEKVKKTEAQTIVTTNPGCLLQMKLGIERQGLADEIKSLHLVEVLAAACEID